MTEHIDKLRRLRVLQSLQAATPSPIGEIALVQQLRSNIELTPTIERVRACLEYLAEYDLVDIIRDDDSAWVAAQINTAGTRWLSAPTALGLEIYSPDQLPPPNTDNRRGRVSSVSVLPSEVKAWLDIELVRRHFSDYRGISSLLSQRGYEISKSAVGRYGKKFKQEQKQLRQSIEMAKAFAEVIGDDGAAMNQTLTVLAQQELMAVIREGSYIDEIKLPDLVRSIASLNRSDINTRKFQIEQAARKKAFTEAADIVTDQLKNDGISQDVENSIRRILLGKA